MSARVSTHQFSSTLSATAVDFTASGEVLLPELVAVLFPLEQPANKLIDNNNALNDVIDFFILLTP
jgi:hypothetical protein